LYETCDLAVENKVYSIFRRASDSWSDRSRI